MSGARADRGPRDDSVAHSNREHDPTERRGFLAKAASATMVTGLVGGYGTLATYAGRFLFSASEDRVWMFVAEVAAIPPGASVPFESPTGVRVTVTRRAGDDGAQEPDAEQFMALSSVCPHLGCRVHWEPQNQRFFCPCHNGEFDPTGRATGGPPLAANQELPRYPVRVQQGLVYIEMPLTPLGMRERVFLDED